MSANGICQLARDKFSPLVKWADKNMLSSTLALRKSPDLFIRAKCADDTHTYALTTEFYRTLSVTIASETVRLLELRGEPDNYENRVGVLHKRNERKRPTMVSVFRQARDSLRNPEGKE